MIKQIYEIYCRSVNSVNKVNSYKQDTCTSCHLTQRLNYYDIVYISAQMGLRSVHFCAIFLGTVREFLVIQQKRKGHARFVYSFNSNLPCYNSPSFSAVVIVSLVIFRKRREDKSLRKIIPEPTYAEPETNAFHDLEGFSDETNENIELTSREQIAPRVVHVRPAEENNAFTNPLFENDH